MSRLSGCCGDDFSVVLILHLDIQTIRRGLTIIHNQTRWNLAAHHFRKAIMANPDLAEASLNLAVALDQLSKPHQARAAFKKAVELAPGGPRMKEASILKESIST